MSRTRINVGAVIDSAQYINSAKSSVSSAENSFSYAASGVDSKIKARSNINSRINSVKNNMSALTNKLNRIASTVNTSATRYQNTDDNVESWGKSIKATVGASASVGFLSNWASYFKTNKNSLDELKRKFMRNNEGEFIFDCKLMREYLAKKLRDISVLDQAAFLQVVSDMKNVVGVYDTLASFGTSVFGIDIGKYVEWMDKSEYHSSFSAVSTHYKKLYLDLLNNIVDISKDEFSFANSLVNIGIGESVLALLGTETVLDLKGIFGKDTFNLYFAKYADESSELYLLKTGLNGSISGKSEIDLKDINDKTKKKIEDAERFLKDNGLRKEEKDEFYLDSDGNEISEKDAPDFYEKKATIFEFGVGGEVSKSILNGKTNVLGGELEVTVGEAEGHANLSGGMYLLGNDNKKVFSPGVNATIGASVTVFSADYKNQILGNDMIGLNAEGSVDVLKASASAEGEVSFLGKNDKGDIVFDPQVNVGVSAEAVLAEAEGSVGVNILGGEAEIKGSVKVGVGANADIGYKDGVLKCEIGASLGIGFDVGFEVDVGGMVNTIADGASAAWDGLKSGWNKFWS